MVRAGWHDALAWPMAGFLLGLVAELVAACASVLRGCVACGKG